MFVCVCIGVGGCVSHTDFVIRSLDLLLLMPSAIKTVASPWKYLFRTELGGGALWMCISFSDRVV